MKKVFLAAAVVLAVGTASAQSSLTLFGVVDTAFNHSTATGSGTINQLTASGYNASRIGVRGIEDLGGGNSASFVLDGVLFPDDGRAGGAIPAGNQANTVSAGGGLNFNRRSTISLTGRWGELRLGRDYTPTFWNQSLYDPFGVLGVGTSEVQVGAAPIVPTGLTGVMVRASNHIGYFLPSNSAGVYGQVGYWLGENAKNGAATERDGTGYAGRLGYASGPFDVAASWGRTKFAAGDYTTWSAGGQWKFGFATAMAMFQRDRRSAPMNVEGHGWVAGALVPVGTDEIRLAFSTYSLAYSIGGRSEPEARKLAIGYVHNLSKRTALYATAAQVRNSNGFAGSPQSTVSPAVSYAPGVINGRSTGFDVGVRHTF